MSLSNGGTLDLSPPAGTPPSGFSPLVHERIAALGPGQRVDRDRLKEVCGTASAANQFLDKARRNGLLVPVEWGLYEVPDEGTVDVLSRVAHPVHRTLLAWSRVLPDVWDGPVLFAAPRIWRDTAVNLTVPMPVLALDADQVEVSGAPPQWDAFHMDVGEAERWELVLDGAVVGSVDVPGAADLVLLLGAALAAADPRWDEVMHIFEEELDDAALERVRRALSTVLLRGAPRGRGSERVGLGPPYRRRVLVPPWYLDIVERRLGRMAHEIHVLRRERGDRLVA